jgi:hypothetical protein
LNRSFALLASGLMLVLASAAHAQEAPSIEQIPTASSAERALLKDAIDIHSHLDPDSFGPHSGQSARRLDVVDMANRAKAAGMRGFVIKQHYDQTAQLAFLANKVVPGVEAFGMLGLNLSIGGLNPAAVEHFAEVKGGLARIVSMPTWDAENNVLKSRDPGRKSIAVSRNGELLPQARAVIAAIATARTRDTGASLALATGHVSAEEAMMVIREAKKQGIERILVTHAMGHPIDMTPEQMKEAAELGAYIEFAGGFVLGKHSPYSLQRQYDAIRAVGPEHVILSSDSGQVGQPYPDDMMAGNLRELGMTDAELHMMLAGEAMTPVSQERRCPLDLSMA